jgi:hypothetical protein
VFLASIFSEVAGTHALGERGVAGSSSLRIRRDVEKVHVHLFELNPLGGVERLWERTGFTSPTSPDKKRPEI